MTFKVIENPLTSPKIKTEYREKIEWWRWIMCWIIRALFIVIIPITFLMLFLDIICRTFAGLSGYFGNPKEKKNFKYKRMLACKNEKIKYF